MSVVPISDPAKRRRPCAYIYAQSGEQSTRTSIGHPLLKLNEPVVEDLTRGYKCRFSLGVAKVGTVFDLDDAGRLYADLMNEARWRLEALARAIQERDNWAPKLLKEFCYLQFRLLCEQVALACLVAHGDVTSKSIHKSYKPHEIMAALEAVNPEFFPRGILITVTENNVDFVDRPDPQITKAELITLWNECGAVLHRGSLKNAFSAQGEPIVVDLDPIILNINKFVALLDQHIISSADKLRHLLVILSHHQANMECLVNVAVSPGHPDHKGPIALGAGG
ncbi:hypothetical protein [Caulobacter segnis]|uniref:Uncharacterized protein n=1 Tax=Caulobacter segnis TaxID=88688 RepID=A0A2W5VBL2_9CAUL|nr:hypothetical protein [Caulobacter segnis]PZR37160.1 MAG: hypothetical protein DI526_01195 [Caulobacter segnis]